uniref:Uncharacterized protein n=1 Tax=Oryza meridionalis TaxID=40149 RepID=A0A0E0EVT1_9ORYZ
MALLLLALPIAPMITGSAVAAGEDHRRCRGGRHGVSVDNVGDLQRLRRFVKQLKIVADPPLG